MALNTNEWRSNMIKEKNYIAISLKIIGGFLFVMGLIASLNTADLWTFTFSVVTLFLFLGFGELLHLLQKIYVEIIRQTKGEEAIETRVPWESTNSDGFYTIHPLTDAEKEHVYRLFDHNQKKNIKIIHTPFKRVCIVNTGEEYVAVHLHEDQAEVIPLEDLEDRVPSLTSWAKERKGIHFK